VNPRPKYYECKPCALKFEEAPEWKPRYVRQPYYHERTGLYKTEVEACSECHMRIYPVYKEQKAKEKKLPQFPFVKVIDLGQAYYVPRTLLIPYLKACPEQRTISRNNGHIVVRHKTGFAAFLHTSPDVAGRYVIDRKVIWQENFQPPMEIEATVSGSRLALKTLAKMGLAA